MSHRWDCPSRWEAERQGERDYERRGYRTYEPQYDCREANRAYEDGQILAEHRAEEAAYEEQLAQQRREKERFWREEQDRIAWEQAEMEAAYAREINEQYERDMAEQYAKDMEASQQNP